MNSPLEILFGGFVRISQGIVACSPTLLVGLLTAVILRYYLGADGTRRLFGGDSIKSLPQSWLIGMLLPVCSVGVLPILFQMRAARVKPGAMTAFALSAPLFNPLSLLYGLTLSRPLVIILFAVGSLFVVTALGLLWDYLTKQKEDTKQDLEVNQKLIGLSRLAAAFIQIARGASGKPAAYSLIAISGLGLLAAILPFGAMQSSVEQDDPFAPLRMSIIAPAIFATPMLAMNQLGMMFQHANSPGAAFSLLILGAGLNLATPLWFGRHFGWKETGLWLISLLGIVIAIAYALNQPLIPAGVQPAGHTHAFDIYTNPLPLSEREHWQTSKTLLSKNIDLPGLIALGVLGFCASLGVIFRCLKIDESWIAKRKASQQDGSEATGMDVIVPRKVIGVTMLAGLVALSVVACYGYYPSPGECLEEIALARAECLTAANSGNKEHALFWLPVWEEWSRRLEVGTFIRRGEIRRYQSMQGYLIRKKLETLEHELEHDPYEPEEVKRVVQDIFGTNRRWVKSFQ